MLECAATATADYRYWNTGTMSGSYSRWVAALLAGRTATGGCTGCNVRRFLMYSYRAMQQYAVFFCVRLTVSVFHFSLLIQPSNWLAAWNSSEANSSSPRQEIPCTSCRPTIHCSFHMILPFVPNLSIIPVHHNNTNFNPNVRHPAVLFSNWTHKVGVRPNTTEFYFM